MTASPVLSLLTLSALFMSHMDYHVETEEMYQLAREAATALIADKHSFKDLDPAVCLFPVCCIPFPVWRYQLRRDCLVASFSSSPSAGRDAKCISRILFPA